ncbi:MAG: PEP-CTERM sorting domain-containing protein [Pseudomonadota bacterium]
MKQTKTIFRKIACATAGVVMGVGIGIPGALAVTPYVGTTTGGTAVNGTTYFNFTTLAPNPVTSATINGALFTTPANNTTVGTGVFNPFLRLQNTGPRGDTGYSCGTNDGCEEGFNTDSKIVGGHQILDDKPSLWTHSLLLSNIPTVTINGQTYRQFFLDINEPNNSKDKFLSLDQFKLFVGSVGDLDKYDFTAEKLTNSTDPTKIAQKIFDMDMGKKNGTAVNTTVALNYDLNAGSGKGVDLVVSVPESAFQNLGSAQYLYLYSKFGTTGNVTNGSPVSGALPPGDYGSSPTGGFEEWSHRGGIPEPSTVLLLGGGLLGFLLLRRRQFAPREVFPLVCRGACAP